MKVDYELILSFLIALIAMKLIEKLVFPKIGFLKFQESDSYESDEE